MRQYLAEGLTGAFPFIIDRSKPFVTESRANGTTITKIPGRFSVCDCVNGNNRRYSKQVWEKNLKEDSLLTAAINRNAAFGLLEHPKDGVITLESPISHQVTRATMLEAKDDKGKPVYEVHGEISLYDFGEVHTPEARKLRALIEGGYNPLVSSRGYGSLKKAPDGVDDVEEDYVCEGWDVVIKPSFSNANLTPNRSEKLESTPAPVIPSATPVPVWTAAAPAPAKPEEKALAENKVFSSGAAPAAASVIKPKNIMNINEIKGRIATLRSTDMKQGPQRFAESMSEAEQLHTEIAKYAAEDATRAYEGTKLHRELEGITNSWQESLQAPAKQAAKLTENNGKLMRVVKAVASTALTYKGKVGEALKSIGVQKAVIESLTSKGRGWMQLAESRKQKYTVLEAKFQTACEALDIMAARYHTDTTELGRRLLVLEFKEKAQTPVMQESLKKATRMADIAAIREQLEGKKPAPAAAAAPGAPAAPAAPAVVVETKKTSANADTPAPVTEGKVLLTPVADPRQVNESVALVQRLSASNR